MNLGCKISVSPFGLFLTVGECLLNGIVLSFLWKWFAVPVFGLPVLTVAQAIGLGLILNFATMQYVPNNTEDKEEAAKYLTYAISTPISFFVIGWVVHFFL